MISYLTIYFIAFNELYIFVITFCSQLYLLKLRSILDTKIKSLHLTFSHNTNHPFASLHCRYCIPPLVLNLNNTNLMSINHRTRAAISCFVFLFHIPFSFTNILFFLTVLNMFQSYDICTSLQNCFQRFLLTHSYKLYK